MLQERETVCTLLPVPCEAKGVSRMLRSPALLGCCHGRQSRIPEGMYALSRTQLGQYPLKWQSYTMPYQTMIGLHFAVVLISARRSHTEWGSL